jgi:hypothetical protein
MRGYGGIGLAIPRARRAPNAPSSIRISTAGTGRVSTTCRVELAPSSPCSDHEQPRPCRPRARATRPASAPGDELGELNHRSGNGRAAPAPVQHPRAGPLAPLAAPGPPGRPRSAIGTTRALKQRSVTDQRRARLPRSARTELTELDHDQHRPCRARSRFQPRPCRAQRSLEHGLRRPRQSTTCRAELDHRSTPHDLQAS